MSQEMFVFLSGIVIFLTPFLGIPTDWKFLIISVLGIALIVVGYRMRYQKAVRDVEHPQISTPDDFLQATSPLFKDTKKTK